MHRSDPDQGTLANGDEALRQIKPRNMVANFRGERITLEKHHAIPDFCNNEAIKNWVTSIRGPTAIDLFSGAGGLSLGLQEAGFSIVASADSDAVALETHAHNIEGLTWCGDLEDPSNFLQKLRDWGIQHVDLVAGGPPCQPFSRAGVPKIRSLVRRGVRPANDSRIGL